MFLLNRQKGCTMRSLGLPEAADSGEEAVRRQFPLDRGRSSRAVTAPPFGSFRWGKTGTFASNRRSGEIDLDPFSPVEAARALDIMARGTAANLFPEQAGQRA
jgi:hypothetical protein